MSPEASPTSRDLVGLEYLDAVTRVLHDQRLADATGGLWEAADLHWWWREDRHEDPDDQRVWFLGDVPVAAATFTRWGEGWGADLIGGPQALDELGEAMWEYVARRHRGDVVDMIVPDIDDWVRAARRAGFAPEETPLRTAWMNAADRPPVRVLPQGYAVRSYGGGEHWMAPRNGDRVATRLAETSLYRRDLDLAVVAGNEVAAYALFWPDAVTGVGLVEPMRVEDEHAGKGLGGALLSEGLDRLAAAGCTRFKVSFDPSNTAAARLYLGAGFCPVSSARLLRRTPRG
jgi:ribosomal protein S18 acetylase RimI-like enzyme